MIASFGFFLTLAVGAAAGVVATVLLWLWQAGRRPGALAPLAQRVGPFLDLLDARYAPLLFVATPQAYTVYAWLLADGAPAWVAVLGGAGFEFVYVGAIAWAERGAGWQAARVPAVTALVFSVAVAVAHYGAASGPLAVLHIGFPLVGYAYTRMMHAPTGPRPAELLAELAQVRRDLGQALADVDHWRGLAAQEAGRPVLTDDAERVTIGTKTVSLRGLARELNVPRTNLDRTIDRLMKGEA